MVYILINEKYEKRFSSVLLDAGFFAIPLPCDNRLNPIVAAHADTLIFSEALIINQYYLARLPEFLHGSFTAVDMTPCGNYPDDTVFNALKIGRYLFGGKSLAASILDFAKAEDLMYIPVKQGYARCSTLPINEKNAAITADPGMAAAMERLSINVLKISPGHIALDGTDYGFIGGASFVSEKDKRIFFFGDIESHPDHLRITEFLHSIGYTAHSLGGELTDIGGAVIVPQDGELHDRL